MSNLESIRYASWRFWLTRNKCKIMRRKKIICANMYKRWFTLCICLHFPCESLSQAELIERCIFLLLFVIRVSFTPSWIDACKMQKKQNEKMQNAKKLDWRLQRSLSFPALPLSNCDPPPVPQYILNFEGVYKSFESNRLVFASVSV